MFDCILPKVNRFLQVSSNLPEAYSSPRKIVESKQFLPLSNSSSDNEFYDRCLSSLAIIVIIVYSLSFVPSNFIPNIPVSVKWVFTPQALSRLGSLCMMWMVVRECMPFPGPPELQDSVDPKICLSICNYAMSLWLQGSPSKITATLETSLYS